MLFRLRPLFALFRLSFSLSCSERLNAWRSLTASERGSLPSSVSLSLSLSLPRVRVQKEKIMWRTSSSEKNKSRFPFQLFCYVLYYYIGTTIYDQSMMHAGLNMTSRCSSSISFLRDSFAFLTESNPDTSFALVALRLFGADQLQEICFHGLTHLHNRRLISTTITVIRCAKYRYQCFVVMPQKPSMTN